ncbi:MAG: antibiotic biosynthesis monooxygenase [Dokdonella sp.]|nr:antibiotic biosynthesis monooxygenase [Xanthomonadales bacterium]MCB1573264.1 antibiotic biosynthesis monooxygenase [Xanthomonadales bacterium]MCB1578340.1 antibiotic biosynthesis monooxygenase [Xanthomonadales bacterium]
MALIDLPHPNELITLAIRHLVRPGHAPDYERWLDRIMPIAHNFPGHLGTHVIRPASASEPYTVVLRFVDSAHLEAWMGSAERRALIEEISPALARPDAFETHPGAAFWFTPAISGARTPTRWKQALLTLVVIYPLTAIVPAALTPLFRALPWLGLQPQRGVFVTACMVVLVVYLIMPRLTRWLAAWLTR